MLAISLLVSTGATAFAAHPDEARQTIAEWVETRRDLSEERSAWESEEAHLRQSIELLERELALLGDRKAELEELSGEGKRELENLDIRNQAFLAATEESQDLLDNIQSELTSLRPFFPAPLENEVAPLFERLDSAADNTERALPQQLQSILALLGEINDFQQTVTLSRETHDFGDGSRREVQTVYLGLAHAYFVDDDRRVAGTGRPAAGGWEWDRRDDLASAVARVVAILENERTAEFVNLPVEGQGERRDD